MFHRRFRHPIPLRALAIVVSSLLLLTNLAAFFLDPPGLWQAANLTATLAGVTVAMVTLALLRIRMSRAPHPRRVLAVAAHPDDLELACGGTLAKFVDLGHEVQELVMSDGGRGGNLEARSGDARRAASFLGLAELQHFNFTDTDLVGHAQEMILVIEAVIDRFKPDIILTHSLHDYHQDHQAVHAATLSAARRHSSILCYESPSATHQFHPTVFVDIHGYVDTKVRSVQLHRDQKDKPYMSPERLRGIAVFRGAQARRQVAEGFEPVRMLATELGEFETERIREHFFPAGTEYRCDHTSSALSPADSGTVLDPPPPQLLWERLKQVKWGEDGLGAPLGDPDHSNR